MNRSSRIALFTTLLLALTAGLALGQAYARVWGVVKDENGKPIEGVKITVADPQSTRFKKEITTKKKGQYSVALSDSTRSYLYRVEKSGYQTYQENFKAPAHSSEQKDFVLRSNKAVRLGAASGSTGEPSMDAYNRGVEAFRLGDYELALEMLLRAEELDPDLQPVQPALSTAYYEAERYQEAIAAADRALELEPRNIPALSARYLSYEALGDEARAQEAKQALAAVAEPHVLAHNAGVEAFQGGNLELAKESFLSALELEPDFAPSHAALASVHLKLESFEDALAVAERALELDPENAIALAVRYDSFAALGDEEGAGRAKEALAAAAPEEMIRTYYESGLAHFNANRLAEAETDMKELLALDPDQARAHYVLGLVYISSGDSEKAKAHLERFIDLAPDDPDAPAAREMQKYL